MFSFNKTYQFPFKYIIPNYIEVHIKTINFFNRYLKYFKREMYILFKGQKKLEIFKIAPNHQKILWINISAPSLGDSLMDLSSRVMLKNREIDLFTDLKNAHLYLDDKYLRKIYTNSEDVRLIKYDLVILDSYSTRSMKMKVSISPNIKYVGLFGFFNGPEVNRTLFSFHQMNNLLGYIKNDHEIIDLAKNYISISQKDEDIISPLIPQKFIAIVLGGEWKYKTYEKWSEVVEKIINDDKKLNIVLLGSKNAKKASEELLIKFPKFNFYNFVDKISFNQTAGVIKYSEILLCCDGGLMHAANAVNANVVSLFARLTDDILLTKSCITYNLYDSYDVNNILVSDVVSKYNEAKNN
tara:strand:- start:181 stop:1242 length:1062 start_codon:yes stop_codon:yes gene_type:complete